MSWLPCQIDETPNTGPLCHTRDWLKSCLNAGESPLVFQQDFHYIAFSLKKRKCLNILELLGAECRSDAGIIGPLNKATKNLPYDIIGCNVDLIDLRRLPASQVDLLFPELESRLIRPDEACYSCHITGDYDSLWNSLSKKFKQNLRTAKNRVHRRFGKDALCVKNINVTKDNWSDLLSKCNKISIDSWQGKSGVSVFKRRDRLRWLKNNLLSGFSHRLFFLIVNHEEIALCWFIEKFPNALLYLIEYKQEWKKISPGNLLLNHALQYYCSNNYTSVDFGYGESQYKRNWCNIYTPLVRLMIPVTWFGKTMITYQILRWNIGDKIK